MATVSGTDRLRDLHAFDDTKAGVKGLVDAGVTTVPYFFRHHPDPLPVAAPRPTSTSPRPTSTGDGWSPRSGRPRRRSASSRWSTMASPGS
ncbi:Os08g0391700 [Oryza sativa Japonica Group]|uniref:Os08g0391700 protein n=1 Tax=Oryza sativa subsp. japonica TaxID=39947 RepID=Q0J5X5_ORYSJ|nr:Os08g0391700 [Oryza sativa Japonica Group]|eukprot:NP_001061726.2 Os08g0391700 [Oryza sativa Japonica Group]